MMSFKLAFKSMKKNMKDYVIYFLTLVLGVAIFYIFNSLDAQQAMLEMSKAKRQIIDLMIQMLGGVSVFVSFVLGFLIVFANNFLIKRRKKEFGLYMLLGMGKGGISKILLIETLLIGIFSLAIGLLIGVFASQFMSVLVANLFEADMMEYKFVFSQSALIKTIIYFAIIYIIVMLLNLFTTSKYKLIDLLTANKKNEKVKFRNPVLSVLIFLVSVVVLGIAYYLAITKIASTEATGVMIAIALGCIGTFLFFYSLSGFLLKFIQTSKKIYMKNLNIFVLRQVNSQVNTTTFSMTIISILLFLTICMFSSAISLNNTMTQQLEECNPVDITVYRSANHMSDNGKPKTVAETLKLVGIDPEKYFSEYIETPVYVTEELTIGKRLGEEIFNSAKLEFSGIRDDQLERIMKVSDYNKIARMFGEQEINIDSNEYAIIGDYDAVVDIRNKSLSIGDEIVLDGKTYKPAYNKCVYGFISDSTQHMETGIFIVPDSAVKEEWRKFNYLNANYIGETEEEKQIVEEKIVNLSDDETIDASNVGDMMALSKLTNYEASKGIGSIVIFIGLYLGVIFLISCAAILALKQLSESADNKERYDILRKIGADEKMINGALFKQIAIFYMIPLALAIIHSIFGIITAGKILAVFGKQDVVGGIITTAILIVTIYGGYFLATYFGSKNIIKSGN